MAELPAANVPALIKFPLKINPKLAVASLALAFIFNATFVLLPSCFVPPNVICPVFLIITPPVAINGVTHSAPVVKVELVLY